MRSRGSGSSSTRWTATARAHAKENAALTLNKLHQGNLQFISGKATWPYDANTENGRPRPCAIICSCTPPPAPLEVIFGLRHGEIACSASASLHHCVGDDGGAAAMEFAMMVHRRCHLIIVMEILRLTDRGLEQVSSCSSIVWNTIKRLLRQSDFLRGYIRRGAIHLQGALLDVTSGEVRFLGEHAEQAKLVISPQPGPPPSEDEAFEPGVKPAVPAEEALAMLQCGNLRTASKPVSGGTGILVTPRKFDPCEGEYDPFAIVFLSFDPHKGDSPLIELIFDTHPSQIATISTVFQRKASDSCHSMDDKAQGSYEEDLHMQFDDLEQRWGGYLHLAEHLLTEHSARLLLVLAQVPRETSYEGLQFIKEQVFNDMLMVLKSSKLIKAGVASGQLQLHGAVYHGHLQDPPGDVEWLGTHPEQTEVLQRMMQQSCSCSQVSSAASAPTSPARCDDERSWMQVLESFRLGNERYMTDGPLAARWRQESLASSAHKGAHPSALVLAGSSGEVRTPEHLFDVSAGEILVHRTCGAICGRREGCAFRFLENLVRQHPEVPLLLVVGDVCDPAVSTAMAQVQYSKHILKPSNAQMAIEQLAPAVVHALREVASEGIPLDRERQREVLTVATELHVSYVIERILCDSELILGLVQAERLHVEGAIAQWDGSVRFLGGHTDLQRIIQERERAERHRRKGLCLGPPSQENGCHSMLRP